VPSGDLEESSSLEFIEGSLDGSATEVEFFRKLFLGDGILTFAPAPCMSEYGDVESYLAEREDICPGREGGRKGVASKVRFLSFACFVSIDLDHAMLALPVREHRSLLEERGRPLGQSPA
jgi:hypothetical protein